MKMMAGMTQEEEKEEMEAGMRVQGGKAMAGLTVEVSFFFSFYIYFNNLFLQYP